MTEQEFEGFLIQTRSKLTESYKAGNISDLDVYTKLTLDYQELIAKIIFNEIKELKKEIFTARGDIIKDNRERFTLIMNKLCESNE